MKGGFDGILLESTRILTALVPSLGEAQISARTSPAQWIDW